MDAQQTVRMNPGEGETSYARNSTFQSAEQMRMKPMVKEAIKKLCGNSTTLPRSMVIADLGCSCGPSAITLVSAAVDAIHQHSLELQQPPPELSLLLNDLPSNDFNTTVKRLVVFQERKTLTRVSTISLRLSRLVLFLGPSMEGCSRTDPCILSSHQVAYTGFQRYLKTY